MHDSDNYFIHGFYQIISAKWTIYFMYDFYQILSAMCQ